MGESVANPLDRSPDKVGGEVYPGGRDTVVVITL